MGACRTIDPARQAGRQQAPCRGARSDERDHVYFEHGMPVACDPERSAAAQHTFRLSRLVELRRHAGSHPSRALCGVSGARRTRSLPMVATRGRTFKRPWRRSCLSSKLKSSSAPIVRKDSWCFHAVGPSNAPLLGSTAAEGLPRIGRTSIATRWRSCGLPQSASCSANFVIPPDVFGQTLRLLVSPGVYSHVILLLGTSNNSW